MVLVEMDAWKICTLLSTAFDHLSGLLAHLFFPIFGRNVRRYALIMVLFERLHINEH